MSDTKLVDNHAVGAIMICAQPFLMKGSTNFGVGGFSHLIIHRVCLSAVMRAINIQNYCQPNLIERHLSVYWPLLHTLIIAKTFYYNAVTS